MVNRLGEESEVHPVVPLDYAPPRPRSSRRDFWIGLVISIFLANGVGWFLFGLLMREGWRDDHAGPTAFGAASFVLGLSLTGMILWLRRLPPR